MLKTTLLAAAMLLAGGAFVESAFVESAWADEVIIDRTAPVVAPPPASSTTTIEKHGVDCDSRTVHHENDIGESKTVTQTDCD